MGPTGEEGDMGRTVVRWAVLLVGLAACGGSRPDREGAAAVTKSTPGDTNGVPHEGGTGGKPGSGGMAGAGPGTTSPACAHDPQAATCPGTTSGRWCVETFAEPNVFLQSVWSDRPDNAWAVGWHDLATGDREAVLRHWNGCAWIDVPNPDPARFQFARGVWGVSANDLWIVGDGVVVLHFDGQSLTPVAVPVPPLDAVADLPSASGTASNDVWTGGRNVLHWDGVAWTAVTIDTGDPNQYFADVWAVGPNDVWATGTRVAAHFDGSTWTVDQLVTGPMGLSAFLYTIWSSGPEAWAAGPGDRIHHFQNGQWTMVTVPTDSGPLLYDLGGMNGDVHLVGSQSTLRTVENGAFVPVTDAPATPAIYQGVWVSTSQVWVVGAIESGGQAIVLRRAR
jgi:hypothetical protein